MKTDHMTTKKPTRGGARKGAGRKPTGRKRYEIQLKPETMDKLKSRANQLDLAHVGEVLENDYGT